MKKVIKQNARNKIRIYHITVTEEQLLAQECLDYVKWEEINFGHGVPGLSNEHVLNILKEVVDGTVTGTKAHRFIGWAQGVLCKEGVVTLDEARDMNRRVIAAMFK
jgi:hypothetical protein